ncbi:MAG: NfeD family protein [Opitutales bacterium]|nr:NfeD family protein [Opitutales bacterium]MDG1324189.1 NfeD family protein [Opitutales bacterium]
MEPILTALFFGYLLILIEGFLPGGILGLAGAFCIGLASYFAYLEYGGMLAPTLTFILGALGGLLIVFIEFKWLYKSSLGKNLFLSGSTDGISNKELPGEKIIGQKGKTLTEHKPEGITLLNDKNYDAYCEDGFLPKGTVIMVTGIDDFRIRIKRIIK